MPAAHSSICLALLPSGPDAVRRLELHRFRTAMQPANLQFTTRVPTRAGWAGSAGWPSNGHTRRQQQVLRQHFTHDNGKKIDIEDAGRRLRRSDFRGFPREVREYRRPGQTEEHTLPEEDSRNRGDVTAEPRSGASRSHGDSGIDGRSDDDDPDEHRSDVKLDNRLQMPHL